MKSVLGALAGALLLSTTAGGAYAADMAGQVPVAVESGWIATIGAKAIVDPDWPGSSDYSFMAYPVLGLRRAGDREFFEAMDDGFGFGVAVNDWLRVGVAGDFIDSRDAGDNGKLRGLKPIDWTIEAGGFLELWPTEWLRGRVEVKQGFNGSHGVTADLGLDVIVPFTEQLSFAIGPRVDLASDDYMRTYYGVTRREAARNAVIRRAYRPDGGLESAGATASFTYKWNEAWTTTVGGGWDRLLGDAADSPIVKKIGSENQFWGGVRVAYSFGLSGF